jgi:Zn-dependent protease
LIGFTCLALAWAAGWNAAATATSPVIAVLVWLGYINIVLAIFNMIPGFPLDGGRVLRAIVWWATGDVDRSTRVVAGVGQVVAFGLILFGLFRFFGGARVSDAMARECIIIDGRMSLEAEAAHR